MGGEWEKGVGAGIKGELRGPEKSNEERGRGVGEGDEARQRGTPGHHEMLDYIPHVAGQHRGPLRPLCKEGNCRVVSTPAPSVGLCTLTILYTYQADSDSRQTWPSFLE